jgi:protease IV
MFRSAMRQFFKFFFASFLGIAVFTLLAGFIFFMMIAGLTAKEKPSIGTKAVLYIDISKPVMEQSIENPLADFGSGDQYNLPGLYDIVRLIKHAAADSAIKGIYLKSGYNANGLATSSELRLALSEFKKSGKFIYAYGDVISQRSYHIITAADKIYCNPKGGVDWKGFSMQYLFFKKALDKLEIEPEIFYAGKFKSATEPFRAERMTDANRLQSQVFLNDIYSQFLQQVAQNRNTDTASLRQCANQLLIQTPDDAVKYKLVDAAKYDDEVKDELKERLGLSKAGKINFVELSKYAEAVNYKKGSGDNKIALFYAQGDIVDGKGEDGEIGGDNYRALFRKARLDDDVKAIVIRVNSGGGSAMASENMWRELTLARKEKPVIVSFGDYAASGGYYMSCMADSIFCQANTLTGSIGVFSMLFNTQKFFSNKLGITFDGVKTATYADMMQLNRPLNEAEKKYIQTDVDSIYANFLARVSEGRKINKALVDSIAQGRIWTGSTGLELGLVDKIGGLQDAIDCAARMANIKTYRLKEYPEPKNWFEKLFGGTNKTMRNNAIKAEVGEEGLQLLSSFKKIKKLVGSTQAKIPFEITVE